MRARTPNEIWRHGSALADLRRLARRYWIVILAVLWAALTIALFLEIEKDVEETEAFVLSLVSAQHAEVMSELMAIEACR